MAKLTKVTGKIVSVLTQDMELERKTWQETQINHTGFGNYVAKTNDRQESTALYILKNLAFNRLMGVACDEISIALPDGKIKNLENIMIPPNVVKYISPGKNVTIVYGGGDENKEKELTQVQKIMLNIRKQELLKATNLNVERGIVGFISEGTPDVIISSLMINLMRIRNVKIILFLILGMLLSVFLIGFLFFYLAYAQYKANKGTKALLNMAREMLHTP